MVQQSPWKPTVRRGPIAAEFNGPGPADITLESNMGREAPSYTFTQRREEKVDRTKPGPGTYQVKSNMTRTGPEKVIAPTLAAKLKDPEKFNTPPPGAYEPQKGDNSIHEVGPSYTFGEKLDLEKPNQNPSPAHYDPDKSNEQVHDVGPSYTFGQKPNDEKPNPNPSPAHYDPDKSNEQVHDVGPSYTFGLKPNDDKPSPNPSPNQYHIPDPACESRQKQSPSYTMREKTPVWRDKTNKPGPGTHNPERLNVKKEDPSYTFGVRHSDYIGNLKEFRRK